MLLEERKGAPQYKAVFEAAPAAMEVDPVKQEEEDVKDVKQDPALLYDDYVDVKPDVKPVEGLKQEPADGTAAAAAEAVTFKVVPEYKEVAAGSTSVKVRGHLQWRLQEQCPLCVYAGQLPAAASAEGQ
jgi:hypothetical protein